MLKNDPIRYASILVGRSQIVNDTTGRRASGINTASTRFVEQLAPTLEQAVQSSSLRGNTEVFCSLTSTSVPVLQTRLEGGRRCGNEMGLAIVRHDLIRSNASFLYFHATELSPGVLLALLDNSFLAASAGISDVVMCTH